MFFHMQNMRILFFLCAAARAWPLYCALGFAEVESHGRAELRRLQGFAAQPVYGECWSRALERIHASCRQFTEETQSRVALAFTHCHLRRSNRPFPECMDDSNVKECTQDMDAVAFNTYTEFFTHVHSICHYLESERWQHRAEGTIHRLTESSAGVAEQLASTRSMAEDLVQAQRVALRSQEAILRNGEELKFTLHDSTQGLKDVFADLQHTAQEQQLAFSEIFGRIAFLQTFVMSESHTLGSLLYNTLGLCVAFLLTATKRTAGARLILFVLVAVNVYLERIICNAVLDSTHSGYQQMERIDQLVALLRRGMVFLGLLVLIYVGVRFRDVSRESLEILTQLKESHSSLQLALQKAECFNKAVAEMQLMKKEARGSLRVKRWGGVKDESSSTALQELSVILPNTSTLHIPCVSLSSSRLDLEEATILETSGRLVQPQSSRSRERPPTALTYSVLVNDSQPRYNLRNRRSLPAPMEHRGNR
ncbi:uncharacterized protein LOC125745478 isoform X2 [Brienomyrus brachyistius]|uniref:uncharacterized protein LOC125745478 isoform X2 n=1 Tax=Brienomyrus brachyistius TaxID=42636 RepID=UPI0020B2DE1B|nr:uncharacterized protein LOC125745478 isoform X2 [Brienomyrus brachyistius]